MGLIEYILIPIAAFVLFLGMIDGHDLTKWFNK